MYHVSIRGYNKKVGVAAVSTTPRSTCPDACPLKDNGCYAERGPLRFHWNAISQDKLGVDWSVFLKQLRTIPSYLPFRYGQAGDLPGEGDALDTKALGELVRAVSHLDIAYTYTHKPLRTPTERQAVADANTHGFTINLSADSLQEADDLVDLGIAPVVTTVDRFEDMPNRTPAGRKLVPCPEQTHGITCDKCQLCMKPERKSVIAFSTWLHKSYVAKRNLQAQNTKKDRV